MDFRETVITNLGGEVNIIFQGSHDTCTHCHRAITPLFKVGFADFPTEMAYVIFQCPSENCRLIFIGVYRMVTSKEFRFVGTDMGSIKEEEFPDCIKQVSPQFVKIYNQALAAESHDFTEICGVGYRKAFEFLIKDYLISKTPSNAKAIKASLLGSCIQNNIDQLKIKQLAERTVWLGNDATHYEKKWLSKDVVDLKLLIKLSVNWIEIDILSEAAIATMQKNQPH